MPSDMRFSSGFRKYFANTSWLMFGQVSRTAVILFVGVYVARYLGPERFGLLSYAMSFAGLFSAIATLGLDTVLIRDLVEDENGTDELLGSAFALRIISILLSLGLLSIAIGVVGNKNYTNLLILVIASAEIFRAFNVIGFYFQSKVLSKYAIYPRIASVVISAVIRLLLIYFRTSLIYFAVAVLLESIALSTGHIIIYMRRKFSILNWKARPKVMRRLLRDAWPLILSGTCVSIYMRIDQVMIKKMMDSEAVGNYAIAVRLSQVWYVIPAVIATSVFPAIVSARKVSAELYRKRMKKLYALMFWLAIVVILPITFLANDIVRLVFGAQYKYAGGVLGIYVWALVFVFLGSANTRYLIAENYTGIVFFKALIGMITNVFLNIVLIRKYGINGAAIATVFSRFMATFFIVFVPKTREQAILMLKSFNLLSIFDSSDSLAVK